MPRDVGKIYFIIILFTKDTLNQWRWYAFIISQIISNHIIILYIYNSIILNFYSSENPQLSFVSVSTKTLSSPTVFNMIL